MTKLVKLIKETLRQQAGLSAVEYALLIGLIAMVILATLGAMGDTVESLYLEVNSEIQL